MPLHACEGDGDAGQHPRRADPRLHGPTGRLNPTHASGDRPSGFCHLARGARGACCAAAATTAPCWSSLPCPAYVAPATAAAVASREAGPREEVAAAQREGDHRCGRPWRDATPEEFERGVEDVAVGGLCTRIVYRSDGLKVAGLMCGSRIRDRGGCRSSSSRAAASRLRARSRRGTASIASPREGFVVMASRYRGVDGGEGVEEFGGADVRRRAQPGAARARWAIGRSRQRLPARLVARRDARALLALKHGLRANAIAIGGGLLDLGGRGRSARPTLVTNVWSVLIPQFASRRDAALRERSAMYLAGGGDDARSSSCTAAATGAAVTARARSTFAQKPTAPAESPCQRSRRALAVGIGPPWRRMAAAGGVVEGPRRRCRPARQSVQAIGGAGYGNRSDWLGKPGTSPTMLSPPAGADAAPAAAGATRTRTTDSSRDAGGAAAWWCCYGTTPGAPAGASGRRRA